MGQIKDSKGIKKMCQNINIDALWSPGKPETFWYKRFTGRSKTFKQNKRKGY